MKSHHMTPLKKKRVLRVSRDGIYTEKFFTQDFLMFLKEVFSARLQLLDQKYSKTVILQNIITI